MNVLKLILTQLVLLFIINTLCAQQITQTLRGTVIDAESKIPIIGATIAIITSSETLGSVSDAEGDFKIPEIPIGRHNIEISYLGYTPVLMKSILLSSGKELVLSIELEESTEMLESVVVSAAGNVDKTKALNTFASLSSRTFSVEETSRYAAATFDPARMAQNFAGVSVGSGQDALNEIVIRGNSPSGVLWRLEGVEIPNPNHLARMGSAGGAISMLSNTTLSNSDFYTGAFPAEFGNATSGVFDINLRKGNNEKREYSVMLGILGLEAGAEGPFSKNSKASYLFNYRYSTLGLLKAIGMSPAGDVLPIYQDLSFKINVPTKSIGNFSLFGVGGTLEGIFTPEKDSLEWEYDEDSQGFLEQGDLGVIGLSHRYLLGDDSYLRTIVLGSIKQGRVEESKLNDSYEPIIDYTHKMQENDLRITSMFHKKVGPKLSYRIGGICSFKDFNLNVDRRKELDLSLRNTFTAFGKTAFIQMYVQLKYKFNDKVKINVGLHSSGITLNNKFTIEPRAALSWTFKKGSELSFATGLHSKMEHLSLYTLKGKHLDGEEVSGNPNLSPTKSFHNVIAYDHVFNSNLRLKVEAYFQYLFDVTVPNDSSSVTSILNARDAWGYFGLNEGVQEGKGKNIGIDLTLEKFFSKQYYFMLTASLYDSKYKTLKDVYYNTRFNGNYQMNLIGGKEFKVGKRKKNIFGINGKIVLAGGSRYTTIDLEKSIEAGEQVVDWSTPYGERNKAYRRLDFGISYRINTKRLTHTIMIDMQNIENRKNTNGYYYNEGEAKLDEIEQTGLFPFFNYRVEF